jgi:hypothetical protein
VWGFSWTENQGRKVKGKNKGDAVLLFVFLLFVVMFGVAGTFISIEQRRRNDNARTAVRLSNHARPLEEPVTDQTRERAA